MTSSLVGSEMCIRDRDKVMSPKKATSRGCAAFQGDAQQQEMPGDGRSPKPVSYTHLTLPTICSV
eukprot:1957662-Prorocentrum_lima.AAC.1